MNCEDDEDIFEELEKDDDHLMDRMREQRMQMLKKQLQKQATKYGSYETVTSEKQLMLMTTSTPLMVIHFAHKDFKRCKIMDTHLEVVDTD